ncbi:hypothetical protein XENTR_v10009799 [Xenopus tropicalis]|uniref:Endonuclease domain-containing 1 protein-like n=1 Tax=Xenopus tropicalis TaxID=8364 RepID=A0A6I8RBG0_XENTR|nr:endonuclease domain-containing 1 protein-like [Xenopus tropicalis]KAE8619466.1 hypothetical protein XENTR_v10009799 [Xenopus tropicalis]
MDIALSLCWLFLAFPHMAETLLSDNFKECKSFFYKKELPSGFQEITEEPDYICQQYKNKIYFATLYDKEKRIPLYSAYIMGKNLKKNHKSRTSSFNVEPQLVDKSLPGNMLPETQTDISISKYKKITRKKASDLLSQSQAIKADYKGRTYTTGTLSPSGHHADSNSRHASLTLTNVAPMTKELNNKIWDKYETEMITITNEFKCATMYVVTGTVPGSEWVNHNNNKRVNIPSHVWSAYCCTEKNGQPIKSGGGIAPNDKSAENIEAKTISELEEELSNQNTNIKIFKDDCAANE